MQSRTHPVADFFPMMTDEELDELANDIKANGQRYPIVEDKDGVLIDGRNRKEACRRVGIKPSAITLEDGQDPVAFILSANITRRHLSKGQQAMVVAKARLFSRQTIRQAASASGLDKSRVHQASLVLEYASDMADGVLSGATALNEAYEEAQRRKAAADSEEGKMERLRKHAIDLADLVAEERMTLVEGLAALKAREDTKRQEEEILRQEKVLGTGNFIAALRTLNPSPADPENQADHILEIFDRSVATLKVNKALLKGCASVLTILSLKWKDNENGKSKETKDA